MPCGATNNTAKSRECWSFIIIFKQEACRRDVQTSSSHLVATSLTFLLGFRSVAERSGAPFFFLDCASVFRRERGKAEQYVQVDSRLGRLLLFLSAFCFGVFIYLTVQLASIRSGLCV